MIISLIRVDLHPSGSYIHSRNLRASSCVSCSLSTTPGRIMRRLVSISRAKCLSFSRGALDRICPTPLAKLFPLNMNTSQAIGRMREVIRRQHKALSPEDSYIFWLRRYMTALSDMPKGLSSEKKLEQFLTDLARQRDVSASSQNQALNAILFSCRDILGQTIGNVNALSRTRSHASGEPGRHHWRCRQESGDSRQGDFEELAVLRYVHVCGIKPQRQSLFGIGYGFLFGIASAGAPGQVWKDGRPAPSLLVVLKQHSELHGRIIPLANLADNHNPARFRCPD